MCLDSLLVQFLQFLPFLDVSRVLKEIYEKQKFIEQLQVGQLFDDFSLKYRRIG